MYLKTQGIFLRKSKHSCVRSTCLTLTTIHNINISNFIHSKAEDQSKLKLTNNFVCYLETLIMTIVAVRMWVHGHIWGHGSSLPSQQSDSSPPCVARHLLFHSSKISCFTRTKGAISCFWMRWSWWEWVDFGRASAPAVNKPALAVPAEHGSDHWRDDHSPASVWILHTCRDRNGNCN